ncbi:MAG: manganese efflux pump MntP family protein [Lentihominibacter sp.]|nr:manganese efflux pump MntP family protein [Lentihominibacter sp.]
MVINLVFFINSILLGAGLAMDAFSVSLANGLAERDMRKGRMCVMAGTFGFFQALMPIIGWTCVHTLLQYFKVFEKFIPWIALVLLLYIGGKMLFESIKSIRSGRDGEEVTAGRLTPAVLVVQGIATSIDALSVGFAISEYGLVQALICAGIIALVTFIICMGGLYLGKLAGTRFSGKAGILGGCILIVIGLEIFIRGVF